MCQTSYGLAQIRATKTNFAMQNNTNSVLIPISSHEKFGQVVSMRELHQFLEVKTQFTDWSKRMFEYGFEESLDYILLKNEYNKLSKSNPLDYALTLDTAKEIAMLQRSDKGKQARQYFIECEKQLRHVAAVPLNFAGTLLQHEQRINALEADLERKLQIIAGKMHVIQKKHLAIAKKNGLQLFDLEGKSTALTVLTPDEVFVQSFDNQFGTHTRQFIEQYLGMFTASKNIPALKLNSLYDDFCELHGVPSKYRNTSYRMNKALTVFCNRKNIEFYPNRTVFLYGEIVKCRVFIQK